MTIGPVFWFNITFGLLSFFSGLVGQTRLEPAPIQLVPIKPLNKHCTGHLNDAQRSSQLVNRALLAVPAGLLKHC